MKYRLVSIVSIVFGMFLLIVVAAANFVFYVSEIRFDTRGAAPIQSLVVEAGDTFVLPQPERVGYTFEGWFLEDTFETSANFLVLSNQDKTLFAKWEPNLYTVSFDSNGGSDVDSVVKVFDAAFLAPEQPTLLGYDFQGWFLDDNTFQNAFTFGTMPLDTRLHAKWTPTNYNVIYQLDGGVVGVNSPESYTIEDDLVVFPNPSRVGYTFQGWFDTPSFDGNPLVAINPNRLENITLYAKWQVNQYTITFDAEGGTAVPDLTQDFASVVAQPTNPSKTGHTFIGWLNQGTPFVFSTMPVDGADLVADWDVNSYEVSFDVNGGQALTNTSIDLDYGSPTDFATPLRTGYQFNGWSDGERNWTSSDTMVDRNLALSASWSIISYPITYIMDRGFNSDANPASYTVNDVVTLLDPDKDGHTFNGWFTENTFTNRVTQITAGSTGARSLFAKWTILTFDVTLNVNGGDPLTTTSFTYNFAQELDLPTPTYRGFEFTGWKTSQGGTFSTGNIMPSRNLDLIAQWIVKTYDVVYYVFEADMENPDIIPQVLSYEIGQTVNPGVITNPGYTFNGWFDSTTDALFVFGFAMTEIETDYVLYGKWTPIVYTVTYVLNGPVNDQEAPEDFEVEDIVNTANPVSFTVEDSIPLTEPSKEGYIFTGWSSDSVTVQTVGGAVTNIVLTASWRLEEYAISYDGNGGTIQFGSPTTYNIKSDLALLPATREGYDFTGWRDQEGTIITRINPGNSGALELTAQFTIKSYTLSLSQFQGQSPQNSTREYGSTLSLTEPTRRGYSFDGWRDSGSGFFFGADDTMPGRNLTLVGQWTTNNYSISYDLDGGSIPGGNQNSQNFDITQAVTLTSPVRTGWTFVGWDANGDNTYNLANDFATSFIAGRFAQDLELKAIWTQNIYNVVFDSNGGSSIATKTATFGQVLQSSFFPAPTRPGFNFVRWEVVGGGILQTPYSMPNNAITVRAQWSPILYSITFKAANGEANDHTYDGFQVGDAVKIGFTPARAGFRFVGWKEESTGIFYTSASFMPARSIILTAQWVPI